MFLATGKHDLRGARRAGARTGLVGLKIYFALAAAQPEALRHHVELVLFAGGYAGLQLVESGSGGAVRAVARRRLRAAGGQWNSLLAR